MHTYRVKKKVSHQGKIQLEDLPFADGEVVEVLVFTSPEPETQYHSDEQLLPILDSLKGSVLDYVDPTEPVSQDDWIVTQ